MRRAPSAQVAESQGCSLPMSPSDQRIAGGALHARRLEPAGDLFADDEDFLRAEQALGSPTQHVARASGGSGSEDVEVHSKNAEWRTTVMMQRLLPHVTEMHVHRVLVGAGLGGTFDTVYVPPNRTKDSNLGFAFVNFRTAQGAWECWRVLAGRQLKSVMGRGLCRVAYSKMQGVDFLRHVAETRAQHQRQPAPVGKLGEAAWAQPAVQLHSKVPHAELGVGLPGAAPGSGAPHTLPGLGLHRAPPGLSLPTSAAAFSVAAAWGSPMSL